MGQKDTHFTASLLQQHDYAGNKKVKHFGIYEVAEYVSEIRLNIMQCHILQW